VTSAQTRIVPPPNTYTPAQDVEMGRQAAAQAKENAAADARRQRHLFCRRSGRRLVAAIPEDLRHPEFQYTFEVVNVKEIMRSRCLAGRCSSTAA